MLTMSENTIEDLYYKVERLVQLCEQLKADNSELQAREAALLSEKSRLLEKNELARVRVDSMIRHLKSMQQDQSATG